MATITSTLGGLLEHPGVQEAIATPARTMSGAPVDIDVTLFIYLGIFLVVWAVLKFALFDPYLKVREARQSGISGNREEADKMRADADARMAQYKAALVKAREEASEARDGLKKEGSAKESELLEAARGKSAARLAEHRGLLQGQVEVARGELSSQAETLSSVIVDRLLPSA